MTHRYAVGQTVSITRKVLRPAASGSYEIRGLVPASESEPHDPCYRIRSAEEGYDRVVPESELTLLAATVAPIPEVSPITIAAQRKRHP